MVQRMPESGHLLWPLCLWASHLQLDLRNWTHSSTAEKETMRACCNMRERERGL